MAIDSLALLLQHYTPADPPMTEDSEPEPRILKKANQHVVRETDLRDLVASAVLLATNKANELTQVRYPAGSMHAVLTALSPNAAHWIEVNKPKAEAECEKFANVVPMFDELEAYA